MDSRPTGCQPVAFANFATPAPESAANLDKPVGCYAGSDTCGRAAGELYGALMSVTVPEMGVLWRKHADWITSLLATSCRAATITSREKRDGVFDATGDCEAAKDDAQPRMTLKL